MTIPRGTAITTPTTTSSRPSGPLTPRTTRSWRSLTTSSSANTCRAAQWLAGKVFSMGGAYYPHVLFAYEPRNPEKCKSLNGRQYIHHTWGLTLGVTGFTVQPVWWHYKYRTQPHVSGTGRLPADARDSAVLCGVHRPMRGRRQSRARPVRLAGAPRLDAATGTQPQLRVRHRHGAIHLGRGH